MFYNSLNSRVSSLYISHFSLHPERRWNNLTGCFFFRDPNYFIWLSFLHEEFVLRLIYPEYVIFFKNVQRHNLYFVALLYMTVSLFAPLSVYQFSNLCVFILVSLLWVFAYFIHFGFDLQFVSFFANIRFVFSLMPHNSSSWICLCYK